MTGLTITHLGADGTPIRVTSGGDSDPYADGRLLLRLADDLFGPGKAKARLDVTRDVEAAFVARNRAVPLYVPMSAASVEVSGRLSGRSCGVPVEYRARYAVAPLPAEPVLLRVPEVAELQERWRATYPHDDPDNADYFPRWLFGSPETGEACHAFGDYAGQTFAAEWARDPLEAGYVMLHYREELPLSGDEGRALMVAAARMVPAFDRKGLRVLGANLRDATARLVGNRVRQAACSGIAPRPVPARATGRVKAAAGKRRG